MAEKMNAASMPAVEGGKKSSCWKIGIIVLAVLGVLFIIFIILVLLLTKGVGDIADKEMKALKANDYAAAYALTSSEFQSTTSLDQFKSFMQQYPAMVSNKSYSFSERNTNNNMGDVKGVVVGMDGKNYNLELQMIKEGSDWKVLNFHLTAAGATNTTPQTQTQTPATTGTTITAIMVNDVLGAQGVVDTNRNVISSSAKEINATVYVSGAKEGTKIGAALIQESPQTVISQVTRDITSGGDRIYNFIFSSKTGTWIPGKYQVYSEISTGENNIIEFTIL
ncbi:MAG: DUF4864 domain-containing protein [Patescibacteria group bacterium]|nr:DUF4864 domain-containing protein [Patescibacteria group bacterium]